MDGKDMEETESLQVGCKDTRNNDHENIIGLWKLVECRQGQDKILSADIGRKYRFTSTHFSTATGKLNYEYDLYPDTDPKSIDKFISRRSNMVVKGIYELNGDELIMLFHSGYWADEQSRPISMDGLEGHLYRHIEVYKRVR